MAILSSYQDERIAIPITMLGGFFQGFHFGLALGIFSIRKLKFQSFKRYFFHSFLFGFSFSIYKGISAYLARDYKLPIHRPICDGISFAISITIPHAVMIRSIPLALFDSIIYGIGFSIVSYIIRKIDYGRRHPKWYR